MYCYAVLKVNFILLQCIKYVICVVMLFFISILLQGLSM